MGDGAEPQDPQTAGASPRRFSAFISHSHVDEKFVRRLHRRLEGYRLPRRLLKTHEATAGGRLKPLFRDRDDLSASYDLSAAVREAIAASDFLIVVCSPASAKSVWVGREIEEFRALHGDHAILATIIDGSSETAFHPALHGRPGGPKLSPLAADFRPEGGGQRLALLRLVAALAGVHLDDLVHRDAQRQVRRIAVAGASAVVGLAVVAALAVFGLNARHEAEAQSARAGGLSEFMVTDLRKGLEAAGRHDLLKQVNEAALKSYATADISKLTPEQIIQLAKGLQGAAKDAEKAGDLDAAQAKAQAAYRLTAALLAAKPNDPKRIFAQAQSEYWVGFLNWRAGDSVGARARFQAYAVFADRLVSLDPTNDDGRMERAAAASDLGMLALRQAGDPAGAEPYFHRTLAEFDKILAHKPRNAEALLGRAAALAYLADCERLQGRLAEATATRQAQKAIFLGLLANDPRNIEVRRQLLGYQLAVARIAMANADHAGAIPLLEAGRKQALDFAAEDPENKDFPKQARMFELFEAKAWLDQGPVSQGSALRIEQTLSGCPPTGAGSVSQEISDFCNVLLARLRAQQGDRMAAAAALAPVQAHLKAQHDTLTGRWGLNLAAEARPVQLAEGSRK